MACVWRLVLVDIDTGGGNFPFSECIDKRGLVDDTPARGIDENRCRLHAPELSPTDQGSIRPRHV